MFTEEQEEFRSVLAGFFGNKSPESEVRRLMETHDGYDASLWHQMGESLGLQGLAIPEEFGGSGFTLFEVNLVLEEMGKVLVCAPYFSTVVLAANVLLQCADQSAKQSYLPGIATGETTATLAFTDDTGRWDADGISATARESEAGWSINGISSFVLDGHTAQLVLVAARTATGVSLFAVPAGAEGMTRTLLSTLDLTRKQARLEFRDTPATLIGTEGQGWPVLEKVLDLAVVGLAAEQVGGAQRVLEMAVQYAKDRIQYGRPIGSFQSVKHKCSDMLLEVESARSAAYYGAWCTSEMVDELPEVAALSKAYCSETYLNAATDNIQIHGGIGFTWEHPAHLYFRRAKSSELLFGNPTRWRELFAERIGL
ncbi:acyl-CoA dehydrogenase family protein [Rhodococcus sp. Leaf278]|uniref:acyl-CoA dehydrogenase family protein n=1 Tax=Rhodococcus sp. Leaf278 TaxID=1736319 RepID=UPI0019107CA0